MEAAILILTLIFVLFVVTGAYVGVKLLRAARRGMDRTIAQARRATEETALRARRAAYQAGARPGAAGELADLRLSLRSSLRATEQALHATAGQDASLTEALSLFERLGAHGRALDDELKRWEREPEQSGIAARLPELRERTERVTHSADALRWAALDRARRFADDDLAALGRQIEVEAGALRHWTADPPPAGPSARPSAVTGDELSARPSAIGSGEPSGITSEEPRDQVPQALRKTGRPKGTS